MCHGQPQLLPRFSRAGVLDRQGILIGVRALFLLVIVVVVVVGGLKLAGIPIPYLDYQPSIGVDVNRPEIEVRPPGFDDLGAP